MKIKITASELIKSKLAITICLGLAIIILFAYFIFYAPLLKELKQRRLECKAAEDKLVLADDIIQQAKKISKKRFLITENDISVAIDELTERGKAMGINFLSITPQEKIEDSSKEYKILPIEMKIVSSDEQFLTFIGALDDFQKALIKIRSFDIVPDDNNKSLLKVSLIVDLYLATALEPQESDNADILLKIKGIKRQPKRTKFVSWARSPFMPKAISLAPSGLTGIIWDKESPKAIIDDRVVSIGDKIQGNTVVDIKQDRVILNDGIKDFEMMMR